MTSEDAEEFTQALGQVVAGGWRQAALGERLGVPEALGMTTSEWVRERLGGYLKMSIVERREAVAELTEEGLSRSKIVGVLGVTDSTVARDRRAVSNDAEPAEDQRVDEARAVSNDPASEDQRVDESPRAARARPTAPNFPPDTETVCPTCHGTGRVLLNEGEAAT